MLSLPLLPGEQKSARYAAMNTIWLPGSPKLKPSQSSFGLCVCVRAQVQLTQVIRHTQLEQMEYSLAAERRRMRLLHAEIITDLLSSSTAQLGTGSTHLPAPCSSARRCGWLTRSPCFGAPRRIPGVPGGRCASRADKSGERGAGAATAYKPPSQHLWGPDHGLDGERGYNFCKVCANRQPSYQGSLEHSLPSHLPGVAGLDGRVLRAWPPSCTDPSPQRCLRGRWPNDLSWLLSWRSQASALRSASQMSELLNLPLRARSITWIGYSWRARAV